MERFPRLLIDGPYGAPAQDYRNYDVLLLVGLGIGATPLISIIRDLLNNIKNQKISIEEGTNNNVRRNYVATKRAYFYWVTREQGSLEWFSEVMNEVYNQIIFMNRIIFMRFIINEKNEIKGS